MKRKDLAYKKTHSSKRQAKPYTASAHKDYGYPQTGTRHASGPTAKFSLKPGASQTKTIDWPFQGAYAAGVYTVDTQPLQQLPCNAGTATVQALNIIAQAPGEASRFSNKISMKSLRLRLSLSLTGKSSGVPTFQRILIIYDRNTNGQYPASNALLGDMISTNAVNAGSPWSNLNPSFFDRCVVLMDEMIMLPVYNGGAAALDDTMGPTTDRTFIIDRFIKLKNLETIYNNTTAVIGSIQTGGLYIVAFGDATVAGSDAWQLQGTARLRFLDN